MSPRKMRRAAEHQARKLARKAGFPQQNPAAVAQAPENEIPTTPTAAAEPTTPTPQPQPISDARLEANRQNAKLSTGPSPEGIPVSCLNHTIHGLARHRNGTFKLLTSEDPVGFEALKQSLTTEHTPQTTTEFILVIGMAESQWLADRARRLQDTCLDPDTGEIKDEKKAFLYLRYQTTHTRAFHKSLNDLLKLRSEKRKAELGFEAQKAQKEAQQLEKERHAMKKVSHVVETFQKDMTAQLDLTKLIEKIEKAEKENPGFGAKYAAALEKVGMDQEGWWEPKVQAA